MKYSLYDVYSYSRQRIIESIGTEYSTLDILSLRVLLINNLTQFKLLDVESTDIITKDPKFLISVQNELYRDELYYSDNNMYELDKILLFINTNESIDLVRKYGSEYIRNIINITNPNTLLEHYDREFINSVLSILINSIIKGKVITNNIPRVILQKIDNIKSLGDLVRFYNSYLSLNICDVDDVDNMCDCSDYDLFKCYTSSVLKNDTNLTNRLYVRITNTNIDNININDISIEYAVLLLIDNHNIFSQKSLHKIYSALLYNYCEIYNTNNTNNTNNNDNTDNNTNNNVCDSITLEELDMFVFFFDNFLEDHNIVNYVLDLTKLIKCPDLFKLLLNIVDTDLTTLSNILRGIARDLITIDTINNAVRNIQNFYKTISLSVSPIMAKYYIETNIYHYIDSYIILSRRSLLSSADRIEGLNNLIGVLEDITNRDNIGTDIIRDVINNKVHFTKDLYAEQRLNTNNTSIFYRCIISMLLVM